MKTKYCESVSREALRGLLIPLGTSGNKTAVDVRKLEHVFEQSGAEKIKVLGLDAEGIPPVCSVQMVDQDLHDMTLGGNEFTPLGLPDVESIKKAEACGRLWPASPEWHKKPGVSKDGVGTGGNARSGRILGCINENKIHTKVRRSLRECGDYQLQRRLIDNGQDAKAPCATIPVVVCLSFLGGFGTGTLVSLLQIIREEAADLKLPIKITVLGMVMGTIEPADRQVAARNQSMLLHELNTMLVGGYHGLDSDVKDPQPLCDSVVLISNANNYGEFGDMDALIALAAQYVFYLLETSLGRAIQEKTVDIEESWLPDGRGGLRWGMTMGLSVVHVDLPRTITAVGQMLLSRLLDRLLAGDPLPEAAKGASVFSCELALAETPSRSLACDRLYHLSGLGHVDARRRALAGFEERCGRRTGFCRCCDLESACSRIVDAEIPKRLKPQMQRESQLFAASLATAIKNKVVGILTEIDGIGATRQFLEAMTEKVRDFVASNHKKLEVAQSKKKAIDDRLGHARDMLNRLKAGSRLRRMLGFSTKREIIRIFEAQAESAIRTRLEIAARLILANDIYPKVLEQLTEQLVMVNKLADQVASGSADVTAEANRLRTYKPVLQVPVGKELATAAFIDQKFDNVLTSEGGHQQFCEKIFAHFLGRYKNLLAFNHIDWKKIWDDLLEYCTDVAHRHLAMLNAADVLRESCRSPAELTECIAQAMRESSGRLRITGEADEVIPTIKFIGVNDQAIGEWIRRKTNEIDMTAGDWQTVVIGDPNLIVFFQQRCQVSITQMIADGAHLWSVPETLVERARLGSDPILALAPRVIDGPNERHTALAMGLMCGAVRESDHGYEVDGEDGEPVPLGKDLEEVVGRLYSDYRLPIHLYRSFVDLSVRDPGEMEARLNRAIANPASVDGTLAAKLEKAPFVRAQEAFRALTPYLRRMPRKGQPNTVSVRDFL